MDTFPSNKNYPESYATAHEEALEPPSSESNERYSRYKSAMRTIGAMSLVMAGGLQATRIGIESGGF